MIEILTLEQVRSRAPSLSQADATTLHAALNSAARRAAPCLSVDEPDSGLVAEAQLVLLNAIDRQQDVKAWVESITTGPYATRFRDAAASVSALAASDVAALRSLCASAPPAGLPEGSFPPPAGYDRLFAQPRRRR